MAAAEEGSSKLVERTDGVIAEAATDADGAPMAKKAAYKRLFYNIDSELYPRPAFWGTWPPERPKTRCERARGVPAPSYAMQTCRSESVHAAQ